MLGHEQPYAVRVTDHKKPLAPRLLTKLPPDRDALVLKVSESYVHIRNSKRQINPRAGETLVQSLHRLDAPARRHGAEKSQRSMPIE